VYIIQTPSQTCHSIWQRPPQTQPTETSPMQGLHSLEGSWGYHLEVWMGWLQENWMSPHQGFSLTIVWQEQEGRKN